MQFPAQNAHPFEFARPVLLLLGFAFFAGFSGYIALNPTKVAAAHDVAQPAAHPPASVVSTSGAQVWNFPKKI